MFTPADNCILPAIFSNSDPSPIVCSDSEHTTGAAWNLFDGRGADGYWGGTFSSSAWAKVYLGYTATRAVSYNMIASWNGEEGKMARAWTLHGSNDDSNWTLLDTQTAQTAWGAHERRSYSIASPAAYLYYKLTVTATNGTGVFTVEELELIGTPPTLVTYERSAYCIHAIMTADNAPSPLVAQFSSGYGDAYTSFDNVEGCGYVICPNSVEIYLGSTSKTATSYAVSVATGYASHPNSWQVEGSINGSDWTVIDSRSCQFGWRDTEMRVYGITSPGSYNYYRIVLQASNDYGYYYAYASVDELQFIDNTTPVNVDLPSQSSTPSSSVVVYHSNPIKDITNSTNSTTQTTGNLYLAPAALVEDNVPGSVATGNIAYAKAVTDAVTGSSAISVTKTHIDDTSGTLSVVAQAATMEASGLSNGIGAMAVVGAPAVFAAGGVVDNVGAMAVATGPAVFVGSGIVGAGGSMIVKALPARFAGSGIVGAVGSMAVTAGVSVFAGVGITQHVGALAVVAQPAVFAGVGAVGIVGSLAVVSAPAQFDAHGVTTTENYLTYAINLFQKGLVSKITGYDFNSYAEINGVLYGANAAGLFKLVGDDNAGVDIDAKITFPLSKFGVSNNKQLRAIKVFGRSAGNLLVTVVDGGSGTWTTTVDMGSTMLAEEAIAFFSHKAKGRYLQVTIENVDGCDFMLDKVDLSMYILGMI